MDVKDVLGLIIFLFTEFVLLAILLVRKSSCFHGNAAWFEGFTAIDDYVALNVPNLCLVGMVALDIEFVSASLGTALISFHSIPHSSSLLKFTSVFVCSD